MKSKLSLYAGIAGLALGACSILFIGNDVKRMTNCTTNDGQVANCGTVDFGQLKWAIGGFYIVLAIISLFIFWSRNTKEKPQ